MTASNSSNTSSSVRRRCGVSPGPPASPLRRLTSTAPGAHYHNAAARFYGELQGLYTEMRHCEYASIC